MIVLAVVGALVLLGAAYAGWVAYWRWYWRRFVRVWDERIAAERAAIAAHFTITEGDGIVVMTPKEKP